MRRPTAALAIALALGAGCAAPRVTARPAHGTFAPDKATEIRARAVEDLRGRGYAIAFNDAMRGMILTQQLEGQATCGLSSCLSRDAVLLRFDKGMAIALIQRDLFDPALRQWDPPRDPPSLDAVEADELALLAAFSAFLAEPPTLRLSRDGESCLVDGQCERALECQNRRCRPR
jgi:hypothetical protein